MVHEDNEQAKRLIESGELDNLRENNELKLKEREASKRKEKEEL